MKLITWVNVVSAEGVATDPDKIAAICEWKAPKNLKARQAFLGTAGYYRQYIPNFATIAKPLTRLTSGDNPWVWNVEEQTAFQRLKDGLVSAPVLGYPDPTLEQFCLRCKKERRELLPTTARPWRLPSVTIALLAGSC